MRPRKRRAEMRTLLGNRPVSVDAMFHDQPGVEVVVASSQRGPAR
ncbi:MAG: hypothetical protein ACJ72A_22085 [Nocardioidaceae bacterium]